MSRSDCCSPPSRGRIVVAHWAAWLLGLALALAMMLDVFAGVSFEVGALYFVLLASAPVAWCLRRLPVRIRGRRVEQSAPTDESSVPSLRRADGWAGRLAWSLALVVGLTSWGMSLWIGHKFGDLPPAYHDEYSYLLQAKTFLAGRLSYPSHPDVPRLFDQMHVLNEGQFASRYLPGTGLWIAPFLAAGNPYWGQWLAAALTSIFVFWIGRELSGNGVGVTAGLLTAVSPGMGLFANLLLAHQPTLLGLSLFVFTFLRMMRTRRGTYALWAGAGLSFAMLCRPMTAAGVGLPFGLWLLWWFCRGERHAAAPFSTRLKLTSLLAVPLLLGFAAAFVYNHAVTGSGWTSTYQLYTDIYTPRHVYGFNNVVRGEQKLGPRVIENYDRWAENLTPALAAENVLIRLLSSWQWTLGLLPLALATVAFVCLQPSPFCAPPSVADAGIDPVADAASIRIGAGFDHAGNAAHSGTDAGSVGHEGDASIRTGAGIDHAENTAHSGTDAVSVGHEEEAVGKRADDGQDCPSYHPIPQGRWNPAAGWWAVFAAIVSLHAAHVPYWYEGIMGWHYVFESGPLWLLVFAGASERLACAWKTMRRPWMPLWWSGLAAVALLAVYAPQEPFGRLNAAVSEVGYSRRRYEAFQQQLETVVSSRPALVLIEPDPADRSIDFINNEPHLQSDVLLGRYNPELIDLAAVRAAFPDRTLYVYRAGNGEWKVMSGK